MKRILVFGSVLSAALSVGAAAQTPPQGSTQPPSTSQPSTSGSATRQRSDQQVTMTGCLQQGDSSTSSGSGATGATPSTPGDPSGGRSAYVLTNVSTGSGSTATGSTGSTGGAASSSAGTSGSMNKVKLEGGNQGDMQKYLNSQVEVRGTSERPLRPGFSFYGLELAESAPPSTGGAASGAGSSGRPGSMSNMSTLRVSSIRQVSANCASR